MKIVFVVGPCLPRRDVCRNLLPMAGINLRCVNLFDHLIRRVPSEVELEAQNISLAVSDRSVCEKVNRIIRKRENDFPANSVLVINGFPYNEVQADYLAAAYKKSRHKIAILHVEPQVYCRCHDTHVHQRYEKIIRPAALRLAEDFPTFTLQYEEHANMRIFMLPKVLRMFDKLKCKWKKNQGPSCFCEATKHARVPSKHELFRLVVEHPKILRECPHISPLLIGA